MISLSGDDTHPPRLEEDLLRAQHQSLARLVPILYSVIIIATVSISLTYPGQVPFWIMPGLPFLVLIVVVARLRYWLRMRREGERLPLETARRDVMATTLLGPAITIAFTAIGITLLSYGDPYQQSLAAVAIWITAIACSFCLVALPHASLAVVAGAGAPIVVSFLLTGGSLMWTLSGVVALVSVQVGFMLRKNFEAFSEMVHSRAELKRRHEASEKAKDIATRLAFTDHLTNLSNRRHFEHLLHERVSRPECQARPFAVAILDLDGFKPINDVYGHAMGDDVLVQVAARLSLIMDGRGHAARMGGDEFALLIDAMDQETEALDFAADVQTLLNEPYAIGQDRVVQISSSCGFAFYPTSCADPARLIDMADMALYRSKASYRGSACVFHPDHESDALERAQIEQGLRRALGSSAFSVHFQPILDLTTGKLTGFEALARWTDPELGVVSPGVFIPIAEKCGLIELITEDLLRKAARIAAAWPERLTLSFNLSAEQLIRPSAGLKIISILAETGLPPHRFEAEVTETALMRDLPAAQRTIENLKAAGVRISLDDFGTGYSSLSQIRDLPLDKVKIDKSFIDQVGTDPKMKSLVGSIVSMCDTLALRCVAEGIEEEEQLDALKSIGCFAGQGYLFARPQPEIEAQRLIENEHRPARNAA